MSGCILWDHAFNSNGYGVVRHNGRLALAHRVAYETAVGPIPTGLELDHLCRTPACVNPEHLEPVTHQENMRRSPVTWRHEFCAQGHSMADAYKRPTKGYDCRICRRERQRRYRERRRTPAEVMA